MLNIFQNLERKQFTLKLFVFIFSFVLGFLGVSSHKAFSAERGYNSKDLGVLQASVFADAVDKNPQHKTNTSTENTSMRYPVRQSHHTLVILVNFLDTQAVPFTRTEAETLVFDSQFDKFMKEQSFGKVDFSGDVFGWLTINKQASDGCEIDNDTLNQFAILNNINLQNYNHYINILNCSDDIANGTSTVGAVNTSLGNYSANVSVTSVYLSLSSALASSYHVDPNITLPFVWRNLDAMLAHHMGHALKLNHAPGWDCGLEQVNFPCSELEYGNAFDVMANLQAVSLHTNAYYKRQIGWLADTDVMLIEQSGIYKLSPIELGVPTDPSLPSPVIGKRLALIKLPGQKNAVYAIERRVASGFDKQLSQGNRAGFYIYKIDNNDSSGGVSLIDTTPTAETWSNDLLDSALNNVAFSDPSAGLTITKVSSSEFRVTFDPVVCERVAPAIQNINKVDGFDTKALRTTVNNRDYTACPQSDFVTEILPNNILSNSVAVNTPGVFSNSQFGADVFYTVAPGVPLGIYPISVKTTNMNSGLSEIQTFNIAVTESCATHPPTIDILEVSGANTLHFVVTNKNTNPCFATDFLTEIMSNTILTTFDSNTQELVASGEQFSGMLNFEVAPNTPPGTYQIVVRSTDLDSNLFVEKPVNYTVF